MLIPLRPTGCLPSEVLATRSFVVACIAGRSSGLRTFQASAEFLLTVAYRS